MTGWFCERRAGLADKNMGSQHYSRSLLCKCSIRQTHFWLVLIERIQMQTYRYETKNQIVEAWDLVTGQIQDRLILQLLMERSTSLHILKRASQQQTYVFFQSNVPDRWKRNQVVPGSLATGYHTLSRSVYLMLCLQRNKNKIWTKDWSWPKLNKMSHEGRGGLGWRGNLLRSVPCIKKGSF